MFLRKLNKFIPYAFYSLLVLFLFVYLKNIDFNEFSSAQFNWYYLLISGLFALATRFWQVAIWFSLLKGLGAKNIKDSRSELTFVYAKSWLGRYIPGTAPWILGKIYFASKHGISKNKLAVSSMLEGVLQITVVMAMAFMMLLFDSRLNVIDIKFKLIMITALIVCVIAILPPIFNRIISAASRIVKRGRLSDDHKADSKTILTGSVMYAVGALLSGISLFFIAKAVYPGLENSDIFFVMGAGNLASAVSMLVIFAPSGIGVREGIQLTLLSVIMPTEIALLVTITTRLWSVAMDFVFFGLTLMIKKYFSSY